MPTGNMVNVRNTILLQWPMQLMNDDSIIKPLGRRDLHKHNLHTQSSGTIMINMGVILKQAEEETDGISAMPNLMRKN